MALQGPWWIWIGDVLRALYVTSAAAFTPKLGVGYFSVLVVEYQMIAAVLVDHFGLMGLTPRPATLARITGVALILTGAVLIQYLGSAAVKTASIVPG